MNTYNYNDEVLENMDWYKEFMSINAGTGMLKIRAYAASEAIPIANLKVVVSTTIGNNRVIFYEGYTNESGVIEKIVLPAPKLSNDNLISPLKTVYDIEATYEPDNINEFFKINMFEDICVIQNINITPDMTMDKEVF